MKANDGSMLNTLTSLLKSEYGHKVVNNENDYLKMLSEQLNQLNSTIYTSQLANIALATILALTHAQYTRSSIAIPLIWFICVLLVTVIRIAFAHKFKRGKFEYLSDIQKQLSLFRLGVILAGLVWGSASLLLFDLNDLHHEIFLIVILAGITGGSMLTFSADRFCSTIYSSLVLIPIGLILFIVGDTVSLEMSLLVIVYFCFLNMNSRLIHQNFNERSELHIQSVEREKALKASFEWHKSILDQAMNGFWLLDKNGNFLEVNMTYCQMSGYSADEIMKMKISDLEYLKSDAEVLSHIQKIIERGEDRFETQHCHKDGSIFDVEVTIQFRETLGGRFVVFLQDITERKYATAALLDSENKFRALYNSTSDALMLLDVDGFIACNQSTLKLFGCATEEEFCSHHPADLSPTVQPCGTNSTKLAKLYINKAMKYGNYQFEWMHKRVDSGNLFSTEILLNVIEFDGKQTLQANVRDISERKSFEVALIEAKEIAEQANSAKSEFLSSMSHELRTPLNSILGFTQVLKYDTTLNHNQQENIHEIFKAGQHLLTLINEVLNLAKIESGQIQIFNEFVNLRDLVIDCKTLIQPLASERNLQLDIEISENLSFYLDRTRLKQVLLNLLSNAVKYNAEGGIIKLKVQRINENKVLRISVADGGSGIPAEQIPYLFQAFNRLDAEHGQVEGTGIGLVITKKIVEAMDGIISYTSEEGQGSTFFVDFPLTVNIETKIQNLEVD
jgi:PAS domain S-box-containing protein